MFSRVVCAAVAALAVAVSSVAFAATPSCTGAGPQSAAVESPSNALFAYGVQSATAVNFAVWSEENGQDDLRWYGGGNQGNGNWRADVDFGSLRSKGNIIVHVYLNGTDVGNVFCGIANFTYNNPQPRCTGAGAAYALVDSPNNAVFAYGVQNATAVNFAIWSEPNGQDDLRWYVGANQGNGSWKSDVDFGSLKSRGRIFVHVYMNGAFTGNVFCGTADFTYTSPAPPSCTGAGPQVAVIDSPQNSVFAYGVQHATAVSFAVWSEQNDQDDIRWYNGAHQGNGTWKADIDFASLKNRGRILVHAYMSSAVSTVFCGSADFTFNLAPPSCTSAAPLSLVVDAPLNSVFAYGVKNASGVSFAVWSEQNGQDDLRWYGGANQGGGTWKTDVDFGSLKSRGKIYVHVYMASDTETVFCGSADFTYTAPAPPTCTGSAPLAAVVDAPANSVFAYGVKNASGVNFAIWSETNGQDDLRWYNGTNQNSGTWKTDVDFASLKNRGKIYVHIYMINAVGTAFCGTADFTYTAPAPPSCTGAGPLAAVIDTPANSVFAYGVKNASGASFAIWSEANGQDDIRWYSGAKQSDGSYKVDVDFASLKNSGKIYVHIYLNQAGGTDAFCGTADFGYQKKAPSCSGVSPTDAVIGSDTTKYPVYALGVNNAQAVLFPVWTEENGQDDLRWYQGVPGPAGSWKYEIDFANHKSGERVIFHVYLQGEEQTVFCGGSTLQRKGGDGWYFDTNSDEFVMTRRDAVDSQKGKGFWLGNKRIKVYRNLQGSSLMASPYIFQSFTLDPLSIVHAANNALGSQVVYVHDGGRFWSNNPYQGGDPYFTGLGPNSFESRVGLGYAKSRLTRYNVELTVTYFVPSYDLSDPVIVQLIDVKNLDIAPKRLRLSTFDDLHDQFTARFDTSKNALFRDAGGQQTDSATSMQRLFVTSTEPIVAYDAALDRWASALPQGNLSASLEGDNSIFAAQVNVDLQPQETKHLAFVIGSAKSDSERDQLIENYRRLATVEAVLANTKAFFRQKTSQLPLPSTASADIRTQLRLLGFLTLSQPLWWDQFTGRLALNQMSTYIDDVTARDTAQISLGLLLLDPALSRAALTQYFESQQWLNGQVGYGFNSLVGHGLDAPPQKENWGSDNTAWMALAACEYLAKTGDTAWLNTAIRYRDSATTESLYEHLRKALSYDYLMNIQPNGLLDNQGGDWIDHASGPRLKHGSSVYSSALLVHATEVCLPYLGSEAPFFAGLRDALLRAIEQQAYDSRTGRYVRWITTDNAAIGSSSDNRMFSDLAVVGLGSLFDPLRVRSTLLGSYALNTGFGNLVYDPSYPQSEDSLGLYTVPNWYFDQKVWGRTCAVVSVALHRRGLKAEAWDNLRRCLPDRRRSSYSSPLNYTEMFDPRGDMYSSFGSLYTSDIAYPDSVDDAMVLWAAAQLAK